MDSNGEETTDGGSTTWEDDAFFQGFERLAETWEKGHAPKTDSAEADALIELARTVGHLSECQRDRVSSLANALSAELNWFSNCDSWSEGGGKVEEITDRPRVQPRLADGRTLAEALECYYALRVRTPLEAFGIPRGVAKGRKHTTYRYEIGGPLLVPAEHLRILLDLADRGWQVELGTGAVTDNDCIVARLTPPESLQLAQDADDEWRQLRQSSDATA